MVYAFRVGDTMGLRERRKADAQRPSKHDSNQPIFYEFGDEQLDELYAMILDGDETSDTAQWFRDKSSQVMYRLVLKLTAANSEVERLKGLVK